MEVDEGLTKKLICNKHLPLTVSTESNKVLLSKQSLYSEYYFDHKQPSVELS